MTLMPIAVAPKDVAPVAREAVPPSAMLHISSRDVPPGGLSYRINALTERAPQIAWVGPFNDSDTLTKEVNRRELANGLPPSSLAEVEHQICQRLPPGYCRDAANRGTLGSGALALTLSDVVAGTAALLRWFFHGSVADEQVVARSYVCNECPLNAPILGCQGCAGNTLRAIINRIVARPLPSDAVLGACAACKCSLPAKTRMKLEDVVRGLDAEARARLWEKCWITREEAGESLRNDPRL